MIDRIGPYEISGELGRGGMGVVYLARDTRLDRQVAIKALPAEVASDPARLERFEREARTLAGLSHPNIAGIHGVEEQDGARYLILEYVAGETLADRLDRGPLPIDEAIEHAAQIAAGVEAAHDAGVIHRDLKPANIKITPDGVAKVLDFGLARVDEHAGSSSGGLDSPTMTTPQPQHSPTIAGAILGTAAYMSPEQARGRRVDKRTDIWSFGVVLYEMLVGTSPFHGETASDSIGAVLHKQFELEKLPPGTPSTVRRVLERCLVRDRALRYRDIGDVRIELLQTDAVHEMEAEHAQAARGSLMPVMLGVTVVAAAIAGVAGWYASQHSIAEPERVVRKLELHAAGVDEEFNPGSPQISPDGMKIAFVQDDAIMVRDLGAFGVTKLVEVEGLRLLAWSPDGRSLAYTTSDGLYRISATGGGTSRLGAHSISFQFAWDDTDRILFSDDGQLEQPGITAMPARGGTPEQLLEGDPAEIIDFHAISTIESTDIVLLVRHRVDQRTPIEAWDGERSVVIADFDDLYTTAPVWSPTGHVLFARGYGQFDIWAVPFSPERMEVTGDAFLVVADALSPSVSVDGTLSFVRGSTGLPGELIWIMPDGSIESIGDGGALVLGPLVSPDGSRIAFSGGSSPVDLEVWVRDIERGINTRISSLDGFLRPVAWSPDQREIAVMTFDPSKGLDGQQTVFLASDGTGPTRDPYPGLLASFDAAWERAVLTSDPRAGATTVSAIDLDDMSVIGELTTGRGASLFFSLSADGEYLLYRTRESGESQVFCTRFPSGEGRWQVSSGGGSDPYWSPDGSTVYYLNDDNALMRVDVTREPELRFGVPRPAFDTPPATTEYTDIRPAPDGERFIAVGDLDANDSATNGYKLLLIENWFEEFRGQDD